MNPAVTKALQVLAREIANERSTHGATEEAEAALLLVVGGLATAQAAAKLTEAEQAVVQAALNWDNGGTTDYPLERAIKRLLALRAAAKEQNG